MKTAEERAREVLAQDYAEDESDLLLRIAAAIREAEAEAYARGAAEEREAAAVIVESVEHSCMSDEHCCALHAAHKTAAKRIRARGSK